MPRTTFDPDNKAKTNRLDYPILKLVKNEHARVVVMEVDPVTEFVHMIKAPILDDNGKPVMETRNYGKTSREVMAKSFIGKHKCFGRFDVLKDKGVDPEVCVTCRAAQEGEGIEPPQQYFVAHVFQYATQPGSFQWQEPLSGKLLAWTLSSKRWNELIDLCVEHGEEGKPLDIRALDLLLGPCINADYQTYEIKAGAKCRWVQDAESRKYVSEVYRRNKAADLTPLIAPDVSIDNARDDIRTVKAKYDVLNGVTAAPTTIGSGTSQTVDDILGEVLGGPPTREQTDSGTLDDVLGGNAEPAEDARSDEGGGSGAASPPLAPEPPSAPAPTPGKPTSTADFDELLAGLDV